MNESVDLRAQEVHWGFTFFTCVDDLLAWLDKQSSPLWALILIMLCLVLKIPLSWAKAAMSTSLIWIGWSCVETWTSQIPYRKLDQILAQLDKLMKHDIAALKNLQSAVDRPLWLTSAWKHFETIAYFPLSGFAAPAFDHGGH